jgi:hypothetical protein
MMYRGHQAHGSYTVRNGKITTIATCFILPVVQMRKETLGDMVSYVRSQRGQEVFGYEP